MIKLLYRRNCPLGRKRITTKDNNFITDLRGSCYWIWVKEVYGRFRDVSFLRAKFHCHPSFWRDVIEHKINIRTDFLIYKIRNIRIGYATAVFAIGIPSSSQNAFNVDIGDWGKYDELKSIELKGRRSFCEVQQEAASSLAKSEV